MRINYKKGIISLGLMGLMLSFSTTSVAQNSSSEDVVTITGVVTDAASGTPMAGVRVQAYNNSLFTAMTKEDGSYSIKVPDYVSSLSFTLEGCNTSVCAINGRTDDVDMQMYSDKFSNIYTTKTTAAKSKVSKVSSLNTDLSVDNQIQQNLMGDILSTTRSGQLAIGNSMMIAGVNSLNINTQPLVVLDGVILDMGYDQLSMHDGYYNNVLANIMVEDIENVTVLKNGFGIYGAKGANGVVIIDTKRNKSFATKIDLSIAGNYQILPQFPSMMDASQYRSYVSEMLKTTGTKMNEFKFLQEDPNYYYYNMYHNNTDWSKVVYDEAFVQNYSMNVQGGDEVANYNLSVGYAMGDAIAKGNDYSRFNLRLNSDITLTDNLSIRFDASYSDVTRNLRDDGATADLENEVISSPTFLSMIKSPFLSPYAFDHTGKPSHYLAQADDYLDEVLGAEASLANPLSILENGESINKNYYGNRMVNLAVTPEYKVNSYLKIKEHFSYTLINADENYYLPLTGTPEFELENVGLVRNKVSASNTKQDGFFSNTYLEYARRFNAHDLNVQAGFRFMNNHLYQSTMLGYNSGNDKMPNMGTGLQYKKTNGLDNTDISLTYWAQANYNFMEKYYLSASLGISSSSRFGGKISNAVRMFGVPWGIFPSVSAAWVASSESWFNVDFVDYLKLNAGFDLTGNDGFDDSMSRTYFAPTKILGISGMVMANIGNNSLQWETTSKMTAGIDMSLFNNRVALSANVYKSNTNNLLAISSLSYLTGIKNTWSNDGSLSNFGYDVTASAKLVNTNDVKWEAGFGIGAYKNELTSLPDNDKAMVTELLGATIKSEVGRPVGVFYGYQTDGVYSTTDDAVADGLKIVADNGVTTYFEAGDVKFIDQNDDNIINSKDMVYLGDPNPDFYGRVFSNLHVKNFTLSATLAYSVGGDVYNYNRMLLESGSRFHNQTMAMTNRWTCEGQITDMPRIEYEDPMGNARFSDRWIEDGSYLRLKNVTLSYKLPVSNSYIQGVTVWGAANNVLTLTNYLGADPEFSMSTNILTQGIDRGLMPQSPNFSLGVKINL